MPDCRELELARPWLSKAAWCSAALIFLLLPASASAGCGDYATNSSRAKHEPRPLEPGSMPCIGGDCGSHDAPTLPSTIPSPSTEVGTLDGDAPRIDHYNAWSWLPVELASSNRSGVMIYHPPRD